VITTLRISFDTDDPSELNAALDTIKASVSEHFAALGEPIEEAAFERSLQTPRFTGRITWNPESASAEPCQ
jgi:hypothetical protein